ncbi:hypothetical protein D5S17_29135 [Pseudonocardiaceae bacterium YIM PH 21723]|nr:hypothetical protein D5S17_29135 [Pseudonocardiaceae bacterium YIM PH 21723]
MLARTMNRPVQDITALDLVTPSRALLGRDEQRTRIDGMLRAARRGESAALVIIGEPGIGKTALLDYAVSQAADMIVLSACGTQAEQALPFAALADVLRPLEEFRGALVPAQHEALALALAEEPGPPPSQLAVCVGTLGLLAAAADRKPVLICADDVHWIDAPSLEALLFSARRLAAGGIVMIFGTRPEGAELPWPAPIQRLDLTGLDRESAYQIVQRSTSAVPTELVLDRLFAGTSGNPLALAEVPGQLTPRQLTGLDPLPEPLPAGPTFGTVFRSRIAALPQRSRDALLVAAISGHDELPLLAEALAQVGLANADLEPAETAGLVTFTATRLMFNHPLIRAAVYDAALPAQRREAHRAIAGSVTGDLARKAYHLSEACLAPDDDVALLLEQAAAQAHSRGGYSASVHTYMRSAQLSTPGGARAKRLVQAGIQAQLTCQMDASVRLLEQGLAEATDPQLRLEATALLATSMIWCGRAGRGHRLLVEAAEALRRSGNDHAAARLLSHATLPCFLNREIGAGLRAGERAYELSEGSDVHTRFRALTALGCILSYAGQTERALPLLLEACGLFHHSGVDVYDTVGTAYVSMLANCLINMEEFAEAQKLLEPVVATCRARTAPALLPYALAICGELAFRTGDWPAAYANLTEGVVLGEETGSYGDHPYPRSALARLAAAQGREQECCEHVQVALSFYGGSDFHTIRTRSHGAMGLLLLGQGQVEKAITELEQAVFSPEARAVREPALWPWLPDLIEAYARAGRRAEAQRQLDDLIEMTELAGRSWARAVVARSRALLATGAEAERLFTAALDEHRSLSLPFDQARTELCYGEWLRRSGRMAAAREPLRAALATFDRLEANPWANRARTELRASGVNPRNRPLGGQTQDLTPQETQVAMAVASGMTNRAAAEALFLSSKTVAFHLTNVYRKLGLNSRTQLAARFAGKAGLAGHNPVP